MEKTNLFVYNKIMIEYKETGHSLLFKSVSDLSFYSAGYEECKPGQSYGPTFRTYQLMHFVLSGKGELHINEHVFPVSAGDAFLVPSGVISYYEASKEDPWCYTWINFLGINSQAYMHQLLSASDDIYILRNLEVAKYSDLISKILSLQGNSTSCYLKANSILLHIMAELFQDIAFDERNWGKESIADQVKFYMDVNYAEKLKLQDVAKTFGIHPNYLTRVFQKKFGVSPKQYLLNRKFKKACGLLTSTSLPISIIANSLGFEDQFAFSKLFKKQYQQSPSEYRKEHTPESI
ncbi:MAG: AraC family transcriptional regulator [Eubacteriales bacterium]|nr:AraC family transcriptional regulator [Eubacteriales bacterium]